MTSLVKKRNITVIVLLYVIMVSLVGCSASQESEKNESQEKANHLIKESSPYLLQHAHNPVDWYPWGKEALEKAKNENKLLLISVGYAACHWCHVMERESFEDEEVAEIMNSNFVCIKVDREERQDIDQIYMNAVQLITGSGGWPLNCFALPDGKPFYGGTYFTKESWKEILQRVSKEYEENPEKVIEYAERLTDGIVQSELIVRNESDRPFEQEALDEMVKVWKEKLDFKEGGAKGAPKFPMPNNLQFLMRYASLTKDDTLNRYVRLSLNKMALGGLYDHVGGGFTRYSTDKKWKVPHFEKMLYDNGQMISLYAEAYMRYKNPYFKNVVQKTIAFCNRELSNGEGVYYSSLDADSEGEEGRYYVWEDTEFKEVLADDYPIMKSYYNVGGLALWEDGRNILFRSENATREAKKQGVSVAELEQVVKRANKVLYEVRQNRVAPGVDDKSITSWNAIMMAGLIDAFEAFDDPEYLINAKKTGKFLAETQRKSDGGLFHSYKHGKSSINGFLEDYSFTIEAFLKMYQVTFDTYWLEEAKILANYCKKHFYEKESGMFYFTSDLDPALIARKMEVNDNVIPSSNSSLAKGLFELGTIYDDVEYLNISYSMLNNIQGNLVQYGSNYSNWGQLMIKQVFPHYVVAVVGNNALQKRKELRNSYVPNKMIIGSLGASKIPLLDGKLMDNETLFYVCVNKACKMPTLEAKVAISQMK